jgi:hypothetical protein
LQLLDFQVLLQWRPLPGAFPRYPQPCFWKLLFFTL